MNRLVNIVDEYVSDKLNYLDFANLVKNVNSSLLNDIVNISQTSKNRSKNDCNNDNLPI